MSRFAIIALVLGCGMSIASSAPISPEVSKPSKAFFGKDLPADNHPVGATKYLHFGHPYPAVQDHDDFDKDFVKDENKDGGQWQAQMDYDALRIKIREAEKEMEELKNKKEMQAAEVGEAQDKWEKAQREAEAAKVATDEAKRTEVAADGTVNSIQDEVKDLAKNVEKEMKDLEGCKKALEDAKQRLKDLLQKQKDLEQKKVDDAVAAEKHKEEEIKRQEEEEDKKKTVEQRKVAEAKRKEEEKKKVEEKKKEEDKKLRDAMQRKIDEEHKKRMNEHERAMADYEEEMKEYNEHMDAYNKKVSEIKEAKRNVDLKRAAQKQAVEDAIDHKESMDSSWKQKIAEDKAEYATASKNYDQATANVKAAEQELEQAAAILKNYRRAPHVDDNGGVYNVPSERSFAAPAHLGGPAIIALLAVSVCWT